MVQSEAATLQLRVTELEEELGRLQTKVDAFDSLPEVSLPSMWALILSIGGFLLLKFPLLSFCGLVIAFTAVCEHNSCIHARRSRYYALAAGLLSLLSLVTALTSG